MSSEQVRYNQKVYTQKHAAVRGLLGGIGTGNISLDTCGSFQDFEIFGHPDKGLKLPYNFFSLWTCVKGESADTRILEAIPDRSTRKPIYHAGELMGLPRFLESRFSCRYPYYEIELLEDDFPFEVHMQAYTPFIPLDEKHSGMPFFCISYKVKNCSGKDAEAAVAASILNACGFHSYDGFDRLLQKGVRKQKRVEASGLSGIFMTSEGICEEDISFGSMALATCQKATYKTHWQYGGWWDGAEEFWRDFSDDGELTETVQGKAQTVQERSVASIAVKQTLKPDEEKEFIFYMAWHFPNRYGWWPDGHEEINKEKETKIFQNYYTLLWKDAWDVIQTAWKRKNYLEEKSRAFSKALYESSLDADVIEALVSGIMVLRSCTCFRISDGTFFGWEGCFQKGGSCAGNCTHVWNYAQTLAFLFPALEQNMRRTEFLIETDKEGCMAFRAKRRLEGKPWNMYPAADGQLGSILRVYREWKLSGEEKFLRELWPKVKLAVEYACNTWDPDGDGVMEEMQHNTYDIEFYGQTSMTNSIFYAALYAAAQMAEYLGEEQLGRKWRKRAELGSKKMDTLLWNGEYYRQKISEKDLKEHSYQYGEGCLADQLIGQVLAHLYGIGYLFDEKHVKSALGAVYKYNFKKSLKNHQSVQRNYALSDESGLVLCTWPRGGRPEQPFVYSDEVWTGIESQIAVHLIYEGRAEEAMEIVKAVRSRYDGICRNPFDEAECGFHYVRSMSSWGLLIALCGYEYDMSRGEIRFSPAISKENFKCFYSNGKSWGIYRQWKQGEMWNWEIEPLYGSLEGVKVNGQPYEEGSPY